MELCRDCLTLGHCQSESWAATINSQRRYMTGETKVAGGMRLSMESFAKLVDACEARYVLGCAVGLEQKQPLVNAIAEAREVIGESLKDGRFE